MEKVFITKEDFLLYNGRDLELELDGLDDDLNKVDRTIKLWTNRVYQEANKRSSITIPTKEDLQENQIEALKEAICEYGEFWLRNGDLATFSGISASKGKLSDKHDIVKASFPQVCIDILKQCGLIRSSLTRGYSYERW